MSYSHEIRRCIEKFLEDDDWKYTFDEEKELFRMGVNLNSKLKECKLIIDVRDSYYYVYATININADEDCRQQVAEYLTRANYGMRFGNFEMDFSDGEVRYKMIVDCGDDCDSIPSRSVIQRSIYTPARMMQQYGDNLLAVMYGFMEPKEAVEKAES